MANNPSNPIEMKKEEFGNGCIYLTVYSRDKGELGRWYPAAEQQKTNWDAYGAP
jgi:hypothetical protein